MAHLNRRIFLKGSALGVAGLTFGSTRSYAKILGANDTVRVAIAGLNGRGHSHTDEYLKMNKADNKVEIVCLVDPDSRTFGKHQEKIKSVAGGTPKTVKDIRQALEDKDIDAVSIATPNHWHALMTIWACQAGKDVYVEKPMSHNVHEGRVAVETARKHERVVQHGTQSRSDQGWANVAEVIKSGQLGKLQIARALCYKSRKSIGTKPTAEPPKDLDFSLWQGPAAERPFNGNLVHYNWHWFWDFGNGDIGNQGVHQMDIARWGIPGATLPTSVQSLGGRFGYSDQGETPNTQISVMEFGDVQLIFEVRGLDTPDYMGQKVGNIFHLEGGTIVGNNSYIPKGADKAVPLPKVDTPKRSPGGNFGNFISAVRTRKTDTLNAEILEGHYSSALCHLANISVRQSEKAPFIPKTKAFGDNKAVLETLARMEEHLGANGVKLENTEYALGRKLAFDPKTERFSDDQANALLTREYRKGFEVPSKA